MRLAILGAGRVAAHLGLALQALGCPPVALGARNAVHAKALADALGLPVLTPQQALEQADAALLAVRDEAIAPLAGALTWQPGQLALHPSGATSLQALAPARRRAGFHPLQLMADPLPSPAAALAAWAQVRIGIEADDADFARLAALARRLGAVPLRLLGGQRAAYHAAANLSASCLFAPLQLACQLWSRALGLSEAEAWAALQPLAGGALRAAGERGLAGALSGPLARGDASVLEAHLQALQPGDAALYRQLLRALLPLARQAGRLGADELARLDAALRA